MSDIERLLKLFERRAIEYHAGEVKKNSDALTAKSPWYIPPHYGGNMHYIQFEGWNSRKPLHARSWRVVSPSGLPQMRKSEVPFNEQPKGRLAKNPRNEERKLQIGKWVTVEPVLQNKDSF